MIGMVIVDIHTYLHHRHLLFIHVLLISLLLGLVVRLGFEECITPFSLSPQALYLSVRCGAALAAATTARTARGRPPLNSPRVDQAVEPSKYKHSVDIYTL